MTKRYNYKIFPTSRRGRVLLVIAFALGLAVFVGNMVYLIFVYGDLFGKADVTYVNHTDETVVVYVDNDVQVVLAPAAIQTVEDFKLEWFVERTVEARDTSGHIVWVERLDKDDLEDKDWRIEIGAPIPTSRSTACGAGDYPQCLEAQEKLASIADHSCEGSGQRVCLAPAGLVPVGAVETLTEYYRDEYGIPVSMLPPLAIPETMVDGGRQQADARTLADHISAAHGYDNVGPESVVIGVTPVDLYDETSTSRYVFGARDVGGASLGIVSTARMSPDFYGARADDDLTTSRLRKMLTKYIGGMFFGLVFSEDPDSPMFNHILSAADLDRMDDRLPVEE